MLKKKFMAKVLQRMGIMALVLCLLAVSAFPGWFSFNAVAEGNSEPNMLKMWGITDFHHLGRVFSGLTAGTQYVYSVYFNNDSGGASKPVVSKWNDVKWGVGQGAAIKTVGLVTYDKEEYDPVHHRMSITFTADTGIPYYIGITSNLVADSKPVYYTGFELTEKGSTVNLFPNSYFETNDLSGWYRVSDTDPTAAGVSLLTGSGGTINLYSVVSKDGTGANEYPAEYTTFDEFFASNLNPNPNMLKMWGISDYHHFGRIFSDLALDTEYVYSVYFNNDSGGASMPIVAPWSDVNNGVGAGAAIDTKKVSGSVEYDPVYKKMSFTFWTHPTISMPYYIGVSSNKVADSKPVYYTGFELTAVGSTVNLFPNSYFENNNLSGWYRVSDTAGQDPHNGVSVSLGSGGTVNLYSIVSNNGTGVNAYPAGYTTFDEYFIGERFTVSFNADGGSPAPSNALAIPGDKITAPPAMTKVGYVFAGWYSDVGLQSKWDFGANEVTQNMTLYAKWFDADNLIRDLKLYLLKTDGDFADVFAYNEILGFETTPDIITLLTLKKDSL